MNTKAIELSDSTHNLSDKDGKSKRKRKPRAKKMNNLSADEVRKNHVVSEKRRRELVRAIYDDLVNIVPDLHPSENRSEIVIYLKTINHLKWLYQRNGFLRDKLIEKYSSLGQDRLIAEHLKWDINDVSNHKVEQESSAEL